MVSPSVGFIGLGVMGHRMLSNMTAHGGFTIASVWDPSRAVCNSVKPVSYTHLTLPTILLV